MQEHRAFRLVGLGYCAVCCRQRSGKGIRPQGGGCRLCRDRQQLTLPDGPGRAADRARGEPGCDPRLCQAQYHRQSQLLDRAAGRRTGPAASRREDQARGRFDLPVGFGCGQGGNGRAVSAEPGDLCRRSDRTGEVHQADRLQRHSAYRRLHGRWFDQRRMEDGGRDQEDPRSEDQAQRHLRARAGFRRPFRSGQYRVRERAQRRRRTGNPARGAGYHADRQA